jgi:hypothetical protein
MHIAGAPLLVALSSLPEVAAFAARRALADALQGMVLDLLVVVLDERCRASTFIKRRSWRFTLSCRGDVLWVMSERRQFGFWPEPLTRVGLSEACRRSKHNSEECEEECETYLFSHCMCSMTSIRRWACTGNASCPTSSSSPKKLQRRVSAAVACGRNALHRIGGAASAAIKRFHEARYGERSIPF